MRTIVGIDEVGRGPLAGPVTVGVVSCREDVYKILKKDRRLQSQGKDSKKLNAQRREEYAHVLKQLQKEKVLDFAIVHISQTVIDTRGISYAIKNALARGVKKLDIDPKNAEVLLDGGLSLSPVFAHQKTIIKGDEKEKIIGWASILAKVSRDALLTKADRRFPQYGFAVHKGYGTAQHRRAIKTHGVSAYHRKTFCRNIFL